MPVATQVKRRRGTAEENNAFTGAEGEITVDLTNKTLRVHDGETPGGTAVETQRNKSTTISKESTDAQYPSAKAVVDYVSSNSGGAMPVGAIFTTPRTGTIAGAVEANGGSYNLADYSGVGSIGALLTEGKIAYVSKAEFQTRVANTGACDSFGWDGATDPTFLVPKLNPWHAGKSASVVGNGMALGLTNGTNNVALVDSTGPSGIGVNTNAYGENISTSHSGGWSANTGIFGLTNDPTKSGMVADLSETTNLRVMVQLATGATDEALETCTQVLGDVSELKDASNFTPTGKETVVSWGMPDYSAGVSVASAITDSNERTYTAPTDGVIVCYLAGFNGQDAYVKVNDITVERVVGYDANSWLTITGQYKVAKNDVVKFKSGYPNAGIIGDRFVTFYPLKGVNQ